MVEVDDTPAPPLGQPPPPPPWSELDANLLSRIAGFCALKDYNASRVVCLSWHAALPPPLSNPLAVLPADGTSTSHHPVSLAVCFLHARRWCRLPGLGPHQPSSSIVSAAGDCRCVGARDDDGWVALVSAGTAETGGADGRAALFNPFTGEEIALDAALLDPAHNPAPKIVFSRSPTRNCFAAVSLCRPTRLAVQRSCGAASFTTIEDTGAFLDGAVLVDVAYNDRDGGAVYCLSADGHVYVVRFNRRRRGCGGRCLSVVEVGTLLLGRVEPADEFPPPYDAIARVTGAKNMVLSDDGALYQVWRRPAGAGTADVDATPGCATVTRCGGRRRKPGRVYEGDVFVLRHDPTSWPHWTVVDDLGGRSFFIGMNGAAVVRGGDGGVRPNCVYYWDIVGEGEYEPVVYSVATGSSVRWPAARGGISSPVWYFLPEQQGQSVDATDMQLPFADEEEASRLQYDEEDDPADSVPDRFRSKQTMNMLRRLHSMNLHEGDSGISTSLVTLDDQVQDFF